MDASPEVDEIISVVQNGRRLRGFFNYGLVVTRSQLSELKERLEPEPKWMAGQFPTGIFGHPIYKAEIVPKGTPVKAILEPSGSWVDGFVNWLEPEVTPKKVQREGKLAMRYEDMVRAQSGKPLVVAVEALSLGRSSPNQ